MGKELHYVEHHYKNDDMVEVIDRWTPRRHEMWVGGIKVVDEKVSIMPFYGVDNAD